MINYWYEVVQLDSDKNLWAVKIMANSDRLRTLEGYSSKGEAEASGQAFIEGIKYARGE